MISTGVPSAQERHVLLGQDPRDHALVAVAAGHLVADRDHALRGDVDLDHLAARRCGSSSPRFRLLDLLGDRAPSRTSICGRCVARSRPTLRSVFVLVGAGRSSMSSSVELARASRASACRPSWRLVALPSLHGRPSAVLPASTSLDLLVALLVEDSDLVVEVLLHARHPRSFFDRLALVLRRGSCAGRLLASTTMPSTPGGHFERSRSSRPRRRAEDRVQQLLFRRQLGLALRRDLADQDVARLDVRADADDAVLVEVRAAPSRRRWGCRG